MVSQLLKDTLPELPAGWRWKYERDVGSLDRLSLEKWSWLRWREVSALRLAPEDLVKWAESMHAKVFEAPPRDGLYGVTD